MSPKDASRALEELSRELDLIVYRLERPAPAPGPEADAERKRLHRELDGLRDRLDGLARALD
jgi:hypothetical protein